MSIYTEEAEKRSAERGRLAIVANCTHRCVRCLNGMRDRCIGDVTYGLMQGENCPACGGRGVQVTEGR